MSCSRSALPTARLYDGPERVAASSDFLLLTTDATERANPTTRLLSSPATSPPAPPSPKHRLVLQTVAGLDLLWVLGYGSSVPLGKLPLSAVLINSLRPLVVLTAVSSRRIRETAPVLLVQVIVSTLVLLYRLNELVQTSSSLDSFFERDPSVSPPPTLSSSRERWFNPVSIWYLSSFGFSLVHYFLFVVCVGVRGRRRHTWTEQRWDGTQESVPGSRPRSRTGTSLTSDSFRTRRRSLDDRLALDRRGDEVEVEVEDDDDEGDSEQAESRRSTGSRSSSRSRSAASSRSSSSSDEDDEDDLIDIPKPGHSSLATTVRHRTSRASLLSLPSPTLSSSRDSSTLQASRNYGSMRSLSGI